MVVSWRLVIASEVPVAASFVKSSLGTDESGVSASLTGVAPFMIPVKGSNLLLMNPLVAVPLASQSLASSTCSILCERAAHD